mgnify:CR=1 FL=1
MVLDTDTFNEIDDQFALTWMMLRQDRLQTEAIYAAPFHNALSEGPEDGMEKSYDEILRLLQRLGHDPDGFVFRGSRGYIDAPDAPRESDAAKDLIEKALATPDGETLYVVAIGAITNVSSAILMEPKILEKITVVWLGGQPHTHHTAREFNLKQDLHASRTIFDCGVPLVQIPCHGAASHLLTTLPEVNACIRGKGPIGDYLAGIFEAVTRDKPAASRVIWDMSGIAWLLDAGWVPTHLVHSPILTDHFTWSRDPGRHWVRQAWFVRRDPIFADLFARLEARSG